MDTHHPDNLVTNLPCGILAFSNSGSILSINDVLLEKLKYSSDELEGKSVNTIFTLSTRIFYQTHFFPLLSLHKYANEIFLTLLSKDKEDVPVLLNARQAAQSDQVVNYCAIITVTERAKYEQEILLAKRAAEDAINKNEELLKVKHELELERQILDKQVTRLKNRNEELEQLSKIFTHDLQEPVRKVSVFTDVIRNDKSLSISNETLSLLNIIFKSSQKTRELLRSIQEYLNLNVDEIKKEFVDTNRLITNVLTVLKDKYADIAVTIEKDKIPALNGDEQQLAILFKSLLDNCFKFSKDNELLIKLSSSIITENIYNNTEGKYKYKKFLQITIQDNGIGFNSETSIHIFKIFGKINASPSDLGMGLAFCKKIVENHEGRLSAVGKEGIGSKFVVTLPIQ